MAAISRRENITKDTVVEIRGVVFGLNRPSIYAKGQVTPAADTLLHSDVYERCRKSRIFCLHGQSIMEAAGKLGLPGYGRGTAPGSAELAQEAASLVKINQKRQSFILKNVGVLVLGANLAEVGKTWEELQEKLQAAQNQNREEEVNKKTDTRIISGVLPK